MPLVQVSLIEGRTAHQKEELIVELTDAVVRALGARRESVRVLLYEVPAEHWGAGGAPMSRGAA